jgi:hypothetical protein
MSGVEIVCSQTARFAPKARCSDCDTGTNEIAYLSSKIFGLISHTGNAFSNSISYTPLCFSSIAPSNTASNVLPQRRSTFTAGCWAVGAAAAMQHTASVLPVAVRLV